MTPETFDDVEAWAEGYVRASSLAGKLAPPAPPTAFRAPRPAPRPELRPTRPGLEVAAKAPKKPKRGALGDPRARGRLLHGFLHHELQAAELMCSLRDVIEPPATRDVRRRRPADAPNPSELPAPRRTLPAPDRRGMPKSAFGEGAKNKRGIGRVESLLTRARGVARQLAPPFPALQTKGRLQKADDLT